MVEKRLLTVRKSIKSRKPEFKQQDYHKKRRLALRWKRPTGLQSKMRHQFKGYGRRVKQGWRSPQEIRGFHLSGLKPVTVNNVDELSSIAKDQGIIVSATVGAKKKLAILQKASELNIQVLNIKPELFKKRLEEKKSSKLDDKKQREERKKKTLEASVKKSEKKAEKKVEEKSDDEKKAEDKKEKDEVLIHKQA